MLIRRGQLIIWPRLMKVSVLFCLHVDGLIEACTLAVKVSSVTQTQRASYLDICGDICGHNALPSTLSQPKPLQLKP